LCHKPEFAQSFALVEERARLAFYPVPAGLKIPLEYAKYLKWFDSWMFY
jgi:hypothetical protein